MTRLCYCPDWEENMPKVDNCILSAWNHNVPYTGEIYRYCPWCGAKLEERDDEVS